MCVCVRRGNLLLVQLNRRSAHWTNPRLSPHRKVPHRLPFTCVYVYPFELLSTRENHAADQRHRHAPVATCFSPAAPLLAPEQATIVSSTPASTLLIRPSPHSSALPLALREEKPRPADVPPSPSPKSSSADESESISATPTTPARRPAASSGRGQKLRRRLCRQRRVGRAGVEREPGRRGMPAARRPSTAARGEDDAGVVVAGGNG